MTSRGGWIAQRGSCAPRKGAFHNIEVVRMPWLERLYAWGLRRIFKYNLDSQLLTGFLYPFALAFEWRAWRQLRRRIFAGEFDVVLRILPMTLVLPSPFAYFLRKGPIPFVLGPIQGGLRSAPGFSQPDEVENVRLRKLHRFLPFARSTYRHAAAIIAAVSHMRSQFAAYSDKLFFIPENGIDRSLCVAESRRPEPGAKLQLIFVGGLVRRKATYVGLRAAAPILRNGTAHFTLIGDGPERGNLEELDEIARNREGCHVLWVVQASRSPQEPCEAQMSSCFQLFARAVEASCTKVSPVALYL